MAIKLSRELALLPYATKVTSSRGGGRGGGRGRDRDDARGPRDREDARGPEGEGRTGPPPPPPRGPASGGDDVPAITLDGEVVEVERSAP
jgi:hypothetical protein